jgi:hypothetical protein
VTRRHHFPERCMPLRQLPSERPFSKLLYVNPAKMAGFSRFMGTFIEKQPQQDLISSYTI